ncbi:MAG: cell wall hydrolase [Hyphomicrobiales bacterium]|nr:cell wall hydrolase [Hyphomicrobiales bacterium]
MADFPVYPEVDEGGGIVQEYAPFVFGGVMLIAAFAFAGNYMGQNANAHNAPVDEPGLSIISPVTNIIAKGSLLPEGENFDIVNLNVPQKQSVVSLGKGDFVNQVFISPAAVDLSGKADATVPAVKRLAIAPSPSKIEKSFKLKRTEKQAVVAQRRARLAEENCMARAIYFEARSESELGQLAVARVILNRVKDPAYPNTICGVVYQGSNRRNSCQFSFACDGLPDDVRQPGAWANSKRLAQKAMSDSKGTKIMSTATNYHADYVRPKWAGSMKRIVKIGRHIFYSDS